MWRGRITELGFRRAKSTTSNERREGQIMKVVILRLALPALLFVCSTAAGRAADNAAPVSARELEAKLVYCKTCHGLQGQGYRGSFPMPRLAGQQPEYFENQLRAFIERRRSNKYMYGVAHALNPAMLTALAKHFAELNPKPLGGGSKQLVEAGKKLYAEGVLDAGVPPCASCHGPDAKGNGLFPRLAGQLYDYVARKLANWNSERGQDKANPDTSAIMEPITHGLTEKQVSAVAAYLSTLD
jgi:cytochrome c553